MDRDHSYPVLLTSVLALFLATLIYLPAATAEGDGKVTITVPQENAMVSASFMVKWELDKGSQGDHTHLYIDGENKGVVRSTSTEILGLPPGQHTVEVRLASKSHTELGPKATLHVTVK